jgi:hypothetical protein
LLPGWQKCSSSNLADGGRLLYQNYQNSTNAFLRTGAQIFMFTRWSPLLRLARQYNKIDKNGMIEVEQFVCHHVEGKSPDALAARHGLFIIIFKKKKCFRGVPRLLHEFRLDRERSRDIFGKLVHYHGVKVHDGYSAEIDDEYDDLVLLLVRAMQQEGAMSITITGHSKGGALAHVFDSEKENALQAATIRAITFAALMVFWYRRPEGAP